MLEGAAWTWRTMVLPSHHFELELITNRVSMSCVAAAPADDLQACLPEDFLVAVYSL